MIWNDDFLFLHYPKAAGKSLSIALLRAWQGGVCAYISRGQIAELAPYIREGSTLWIEGSHQNAIKARQLLASRHDREIASFKAVFLAVRNPYDLICSTYFFHRQSHERGSHRPSFALAASTTLEQFIREWVPTRFEPWMQIDGRPLPNLRIIRFEEMARDLRTYAQEFGFRPVSIPHLNAGSEKDYSAMLSPELREIIFHKYRFLFDLGIYTPDGRIAASHTAEPVVKAV
jgi:hypothetical protein